MRASPGLTRALWFAAIWAGSVLFLSMISLLIRTALGL